MGPAWPHQPDLAPHTGVGGGACVSRARGIRVRAPPPRGVVAGGAAEHEVDFKRAFWTATLGGAHALGLEAQLLLY